MDIKSKSFSHSLLAKGLAFVVAIICFTGAIYSFVATLADNGASLDMFRNSYYDSSDFEFEVNSAMAPFNILYEYKSEDYIKSGETVTDDRISYEKEALYSSFTSSSEYNPGLSYEENYSRFESLNSEKISGIKESLINQDLQSYRESLENLENLSGIVYYMSDGEHVFSNTEQVSKEAFESYPVYFLSEGSSKGITQSVFPDQARRVLYNINNMFLSNAEYKVYFAFTEDFVKDRNAEFEKKRNALKGGLSKTSGFMAGLLVSFIYLVVTTGRRSFKDNVVHMSRFDKLYTDINVILCFTVVGIWFAFLEVIGVAYAFEYKFILPITALLGSIGLLLVLSMVRHIKSKSFLKHTLIYTVCSKVFLFFKDIYDSGSVAIKVAVAVVAYPLIVAATFFMFPVTIGLGVWLAHRKVRQFLAISEGVEKIRSGDVAHSIEIDSDGEFKSLAESINSIKDGLGGAIERELKSERMKTELITNVSHDIRTPLTSIITYVDLLKNESDPDKSAEYIKVLEQKSQRLKTLTDDLFDAAKATSGNIPVELEKIDIVSLINQGLAELDRGEKKLDFRIDSSFENLFVLADGRLLWRSIENLLSNVFKYALDGSRVYLDFEEFDSSASLTIKNISAYELNITSEELMERFTRGDESRTSEGSGLGLSIAKSLVEAQGGHLDIEIDGDLFKAKIELPRH